MVFAQMEEYSQSHWDVWHVFIHGWAIHAHCRLCCSPACLCVSHCVSPVPLSGTQHGAPTPLNTRDKHSWQSANRCYATEPTTHASPLKATGTVYRTQSQGYENTTYQAHSQGCGKTASLSCPYIWVRKPDCLHLPYSNTSQSLMHYIITCSFIYFWETFYQWLPNNL